jgi:hypothetical protein
MRVLLVLALRGERRSFCKSVRLILFPLETNTPTKSCGGKQRARERCVFFRQRMTCARAEVKPLSCDEVKLNQILKKGEFSKRVFLGGPSLRVLFLGNDRFSTPFERFPYFFLGVLSRETREERARKNDLSLSLNTTLRKINVFRGTERRFQRGSLA